MGALTTMRAGARSPRAGGGSGRGPSGWSPRDAGRWRWRCAASRLRLGVGGRSASDSGCARGGVGMAPERRQGGVARATPSGTRVVRERRRAAHERRERGARESRASNARPALPSGAAAPTATHATRTNSAATVAARQRRGNGAHPSNADRAENAGGEARAARARASTARTPHERRPRGFWPRPVGFSAAPERRRIGPMTEAGWVRAHVQSGARRLRSMRPNIWSREPPSPPSSRLSWSRTPRESSDSGRNQPCRAPQASLNPKRHQVSKPDDRPVRASARKPTWQVFLVPSRRIWNKIKKRTQS